MAVTETYRGLTRTSTKSGQKITEKFVGLKADIDEFVKQYNIGNIGTYGSLSSINVFQDQGPFWICELEWAIEYDDFTGGNIPAGSSSGPTQSFLTVRMLSLPLEKSLKYRTNWNYILISTIDILPEWWATATTTLISGTDYLTYKWIKEPSEIPNLDEGTVWRIIAAKTKPRS